MNADGPADRDFAPPAVVGRPLRRVAFRASIVVVTMIGLAVAFREGAPLDSAAIARLMEGVGWIGFLIYVVYSLLVFVLLGAAWLLVMGQRWRWLPAFIWARLIREAASDFLPFSQIGGIVVGADSLIARGMSGTSVYASLTVDLTTEIASQALFTFVTIGWYAMTWQGTPEAPLQSAVIASFVAFILLVVVAGSTPRWLPLVAPKILNLVLPNSLTVVHEIAGRLREMYGNRARIAAATLINSVAWSMSATGAWIVLRFMGSDLSWNVVLALEAFIFALRSVAFMVPGGIGVQEAGYALAASMFGLPIEAAVVLAIAKRCKDVAIGLPTLMAWQVVQARQVIAALKRPGHPNHVEAFRR